MADRAREDLAERLEVLAERTRSCNYDDYLVLREASSLLRQGAQTCGTCQFHNPEGEVCRKYVGRPNRIGPDRVDAFTFGCTLHQPFPSAPSQRAEE